MNLKPRNVYRYLVSILIGCLLSLIAYAAPDQESKSILTFYDGKWEGYADTPEGRFELNMEIRDGIMSGHFEDTKIEGYINADRNLVVSPFTASGAQVILETNFMSPGRIEGILIGISYKASWFVATHAPANPEAPIAHIVVNKNEPWTGKWKVETTSQGGGIWAMKQEGQVVKSTRDSAYEFKGKVQGNRLKGNMFGASGTLLPFAIEMPSDAMSFKGTADMGTSRTNHLKGKRIE